MPNHVSIDLWVTGPGEDIVAFQEFAKEDDWVLSANKFIPYPEHFQKLDDAAKEAKKAGEWITDGYNSGGYEWCMENWGTKWGIYSVALKETKQLKKLVKVKYVCQSAWSPPIAIIKAMSEKFSSLRFKMKYYERGSAFKGTFTVKSGNILKAEQSDYHGRRGG